MNRRVRRKCAKGPQKADLLDQPETENADCLKLNQTEKENADCLKLNEDGIVDWTRLPGDIVINLFLRLNDCDRANLSSTCTTWRSVGSSSCLWQSLDLRAHRCEYSLMRSLASRCSNLQKLRFRGSYNADSLINIRAKNLKELSCVNCKILTDKTLTLIVARHNLLESIQLGPDLCERITSEAIVTIAVCCPKLKKLRLSGISDVSHQAISALAKHCPDLHDIGFIDCLNISEVSLANVVPLRFLSVAGTTNIDWDLVGKHWCSLPYLEGLDVSRTNVDPENFMRLILSIDSLKVVCALDCLSLEEDTTIYTKAKRLGKIMLGFSNNIFKELSSMFPDTEKEDAVFSDWRNGSKKDVNLDELMTWVEWVLTHALLHLAEANPFRLDQFWLNQGVDLLLSLLQSIQEDVQEGAAIGLATFAVVNDVYIFVDVRQVEAVMKGGGVHLLLGLARSFKEGLQLEATKAIANLSMGPAFAKSVSRCGGIVILASLAKSMNKLVAEEAAGALWNMCIGDEHMGAIADAGGIKALVDLIFKWPRGGDGAVKHAAGALANLATNDKCSMEVVAVGGINALVTLVLKCKHEGVQEQAARALANLTVHGDRNTNNATVGQEDGAIGALVLLIRSKHDAVRQEAAGALWNLSFDARNRERIALAGGIETLVSLAKSCSNASPRLQERAAGALWGLSVSEANRIAIGQEGGVTALIRLAQSQIEDVQKPAAGALWNLAFDLGNALRIVEDGVLPDLINLCSSRSKMVRFMAALALAYIFDGRLAECGKIRGSAESGSKRDSLKVSRNMALTHIHNFVLTFADRCAFCSEALSIAPAVLARITRSSRIPEAGQLRCSEAEIGRFVSMLRNQYPMLKSCAAFALLQFTAPGGRYAPYHVNLLQALCAPRALRVTAAEKVAPLEARVYARCVLRNLEY